MKMRRFTARTSRDALAQVREAFGDDAVVLSTKPCAEGIEVLAMAADGMQHIEHLAQTAPRATRPGALAPAITAPAPAPAPASARAARQPSAPATGTVHEVHADTEQLAMSTLSFQDYVRERMLKRRQAALQQEREHEPVLHEPARPALTPAQQALMSAMARHGVPAEPALAMPAYPPPPAPAPAPAPARAAAPVATRSATPPPPARPAARREPPVLRDTHPHEAELSALAEPAPAATRRDQQDMISELRAMKGLIEERFGALAFMEKLQRQPGQARLAQKLLDAAFSPALIRKLADGLPADAEDEMAWAAGVLERNLLTGEHDLPIEDQGGVFAMIGSTGVGKTTSTAKIAAAFATRHGAANLGLITLDAYRVAAHEQLRAYGRILGVPVHTAHDRATLEDLLELLGGKKMVLIDTAGIGQRDARTRDLLDMLGHRAINKLLVINAAAQGETIEDVMTAYGASACAGIVLSKIDESMKLGPALDALIRRKLKVVGVANGQRVPEDWHRLSSHALVQRALRAATSTAYRMDPSDVNLVFATAHRAAAAAAGARA